MKWYEPTAEKLAFDKVYTRATIIDLLRQDYPYVSFNSYAWAVNSLVEEGKITRIGRNQYVRASEHDKSAFHPVYSAAMNELIRDIDNAFADCRFVVFESGLLEQIGFSVSRHLTFIEVDRKQSEAVFRFLQARQYPNLLYKPSPAEYQKYVTEGSIIIRDMVSEAPLNRAEPHAICIEKLLVDIFCDPLLKDTYNIEEYESVAQAAFDHYIVELPRLLRYACRRKRKDEIIIALGDRTRQNVENARENYQREMLDRAGNIISTLPESQQELFDDISNDVLSQAEMARYYHVKPQAITNRINRLYKTITKRLYEEYGYTDDDIRSIGQGTPLSFIRHIRR